MTLFRQLFIGVSIGFLFLLFGIEIIYIDNAKTYLQKQLASHSQDAATALGMVLPSQMEASDSILIETTINAVFDRGFYQDIQVINSRGNTLVSKHLPPTPSDVPQWFTRAIVLEAPIAESMITKGWRQLGRVIVISHPNFAYQQLWKTTLGTMFWLIMLYLFCLILLRVFLRTILRPLEEIESVALSISERDFKTISVKPRTRELKRVVQAINSLSSKIRIIIENEIATVNRLLHESNADHLTQLDNRKSFESKMGANLDTRVGVQSGVIYITQIDKFDSFNLANGFKAGDKLLKAIGDALFSVDNYKGIIRARINAATFVFAAFNLNRDEAEALGLTIYNQVHKIIEASISGIAMSYGCGGAFYQKETPSLGALMALADMAMLQSSYSREAKPIMLDYKESTEGENGSQYWKNLIIDTLAANRIDIVSQPVISFDQSSLLQLEIVGCLTRKTGESISEDKFMPMAIRHNLTPLVERMILEKAFKILDNDHESDTLVAVNLFVNTVNDPEFVYWLMEFLAEKPGIAKRIVFEFAEFGVVRNFASIVKFVTQVRKFGVHIAIDNFGLHRSSFDYLQKLLPTYIKISYYFIEDLINNKNYQFISSIVNVTRSLEIKTIAPGVANEAVFEKLKEIGVYAYQGQWSARLDQCPGGRVDGVRRDSAGALACGICEFRQACVAFQR